MRNKALPFALAVMTVFAASCDSGAEKAAFDKYEAAVSDVLEEEAELRKRYEEEFANMQAYNSQDAFDLLVRQKMIPFYEEMKKTVGAVSPEGDELKRIHGLLIRYAGLCSEMVKLDTKSVTISEMEKPALDRLNRAMSEREKATRGFNDALSSLPELMQKLAAMFTTEQQAALTVVQSLQLVRKGEVSPADFLKYLDDQIDPFYEKLVTALAELQVSPAEQAAMLKAKAYVGTTMALFIAAREIASVRPKMLEELAPLRERLAELQVETTGLLDDYRKEARAYRDSLR